MSDCAGMHSMLFCKYWREIPTFPQEHTLGKRLGETLYLNLLPNYDIIGTLKLNVGGFEMNNTTKSPFLHLNSLKICKLWSIGAF